MATYDRTANRQDKKTKKGKKGGGQQPARKRKHYSIFIPIRKVARMLKSSGPEFVAELVVAEAKAGKTDEIGVALRTLANNACYNEYGSAIQKLAQKATVLVK